VEGPGGGGGLLVIAGVDEEEEVSALVEGLHVFSVQLAVNEEHVDEGRVVVGDPVPEQMRAGQVGVYVVGHHVHGGEEVVVDLEAELGGEGEEGGGSFGTVGARHIGSVGLGSIAWLGWWEAWYREGVGVIWGGWIGCLRIIVDSVRKFCWNKLKLNCRLALRVGTTIKLLDCPL